MSNAYKGFKIYFCNIFVWLSLGCGPILENNGMLLSIEKKLICKESGMT
jgi:hypothetical protein